MDGDTLIATLTAQADRFIRRGHGKRVHDLVRTADAMLARRLVALGGLSDRFGDRRLQLYRAQTVLVSEYAAQRLAGLTHEQALRAIRVAVVNTARIADAMERDFTGGATPIGLSEAARRDRVVSDVDSSLLHRYARSTARYGDRMVRAFESTLQQGFIAGASNADMIRALIHRAPKGIAERLHAHEPAWFPDPRLNFVTEQYWAERIVRTEVANAYNESSQQSIADLQRDLPDMKRKILAVRDMRTSLDSMGVHGQVRGLGEMFTDGAGRSYLRPPARPNDRETIIPWREAWKTGKSTKPIPEEEQRKAEEEQKKAEEARKQRRTDTV